MNSMFRFENPTYIYFLLIIPILLAFYIVFRIYRNKRLNNFASKEMQTILMPEHSNYKSHLRITLYLLALSSLIIAAANPQIGSKMEEVKREGIEVMIALDVSNSMLSEDIRPNRLERAKQNVNKLIDKLDNDKIGLVIFAGEPFLQIPMTTDYSAAKLILSGVSTDQISTQGTAIGSAIETAEKAFSKNNPKMSKVLIVITDGENHEDDAVGAATIAKNNGIIVHTIGMGSPNGGPIPIYNGNVKNDYLKDRDGSIVITKTDAEALRQIASAGGGKFLWSSGSDPDLSQLIKEISGMTKTLINAKVYTEYDDKFFYFLFLALVFLLLEILISEKKNKYVTMLNNFVSKS